MSSQCVLPELKSTPVPILASFIYEMFSSFLGNSGGGTGKDGARMRNDSVASSSSGVSSQRSSILPDGATVQTPFEAMKSKNVDSIRALISVAQTDGNYLGSSWLDILRCISQLESANVIATTPLTPRVISFTSPVQRASLSSKLITICVFSDFIQNSKGNRQCLFRNTDYQLY